ncbi:MAG: DUF559 domain-containing protein [Elusimicrobia bacterium]|nr:DUF559 domain-containing protein [Elusimicrobiota bacterium]
MRQKSTPAEHIFWEIVKNRKFLNLKFRRQHQIGKYIIDFYCDEQKLVIEIDGTIHNTPQRQKIDHKRNGYLKKLGINIIRVSNKEILNDIENTLKIIASSLPSTFGRGVGGEGKEGKVLFIDARNMGEMIDRRHRELTDKEINKISDTYHAWRGEGGKYKDIKGFCKNASFDEIKKNGYILTPGRYVGIKEIEEDDEKFEEKMKRLTSELSKQMKQGKKLDEEIKKNLTGIGYEI